MPCSKVCSHQMAEVLVYGMLWPHLEPSQELDLRDRKVVVSDLLTQLGIDPSEVGIITIDGRQSTLDQAIPADGRICIFPPLMGG